jgi:dTDP-4-amino-4,6-dideoxygalactose transaminase
MNIPLVNLVRQYKEIQKTVDHAILAVCKKSDFILGDEVATFEREFAEYLGVRYCVGVASGTLPPASDREMKS